MRRETWVCGTHAVRPAGKPDECFYCHVPVGATHLPDCVIRQRTVVVRFTVDLVVSAVEGATPEQIEFRYNEGSWCADNLAELLMARADRSETSGSCLCPVTMATYVREATPDDERDDGLTVEDLES